MQTYVSESMEREDFPQAEVNAIMEAMRYVFHSWAYLPSDPVSSPGEAIAPLALERSVRLSGPAPVFLNVRTVPELSDLLAQCAEGETKSSADREDAFQEFVNIFCGHLMTYLWGKDGAVFDPYLPVPTSPSDWPKSKPSARCAFIVENMPIEVRLWLQAEEK
jgi:hypothetical protein